MQDTSIEEHGPAPRRASPRLVIEARAAIGLVKPYLARMNAWQLEAAHLRAMASARQSSDGERQTARQRLAELRREAEAAYADLLRQVPDGKRHSRIEDTCRALKRFADMVGKDGSGMSAYGL